MSSFIREYRKRWQNATRDFQIDKDTVKIIVITSIVAPIGLMALSKLIDYGIAKYKEKKGIK